MGRIFRDRIAVILALCLAAGLVRGAALDLSLHIVPDALVPLSPSFAAGGGLSLSLNAELLHFMSPSIEAGLQIAPISNSTLGLTLLNGGFGLRFFMYPSSRLELGLGVSGGVYKGIFGAQSRTDLYWKGSLNAGYRLSPSLSLIGDIAYANYYENSAVLFPAISAGLSVEINLGILGQRSSGFKFEELGSKTVFPIEYASYAKSPIGSVRITNTEQAEIRKVRVTFSLGEFTTEEAVCATFAYIARGESVDVPLYAVFGPNLLALTESVKMQGRLRVEYELLGSPLSVSKSESLSFYHRNALTWGDPSITGAFISPNNPAVLDLSKYVAGLVRDRIRPDLDKPLQYAMGLFEGLRLLGLKYGADPSTPYAVWHKDPGKVDYLQYPDQTLSYKGGDSDDLAVLYSALLESVNVVASLIFLDDEVLVAIRLDLDEGQVRSTFTNAGDFIFSAGTAWLPVEPSRMKEGFIAAWQGGAASWRSAQAAGKARFLEVGKAWEIHPPLGLPGNEYRSPKPDAEQIDLAFENAMSRFIAKEAEPKAQRLLADMGRSGTGKQYNSLGILYARYGLFQKAFDAFLVGVKLGYAPCFVNLANVAYLQKDFEAAIGYYEAALRVQPDNKNALIGLARSKYEVDAYTDADALYSRVLILDPKLAARFAYLSSRVDASTSRASSAAADRGGASAWDEEP